MVGNISEKNKRKNRINFLTKGIASIFKNNLSSILLYGSNLDQYRKTNDIDMIIILKIKKSSLEDLKKIREILCGIEKDIDLQLLYEKELTDGNTFSLDTHGQFIVEELKNAIPLYGENPFVLLFPSAQICQLSIVQKLQYYIFRARQELLGYNFSTKDQSKDFHRKKIKMAMLDLLLAKQITLKTTENIFKVFIQNYPKTITDNFHLLLKERAPLEIEGALPIYEALYDEALFMSTKIYPKQMKPKIAKKNGIFFEYLIPKNKTGKIPFIILCEGLPAKPCQNKLMNILVDLGYGVLYPRYGGTWESEGVFLERKPGEEISYLAEKLLNGLVLGGTNITAKKITLIATSFGASVALSIAENKNINKIIALSPILNFKNLPSLDSLRKFLQKMYSTTYRFTASTWENLASGECVPSASSVNKKSVSKIFLFGGYEDKEISPIELMTWGKKIGISSCLYKNMGHLSFSKVKGKLLKDIVSLLNLPS